MNDQDDQTANKKQGRVRGGPLPVSQTEINPPSNDRSITIAPKLPAESNRSGPRDLKAPRPAKP